MTNVELRDRVTVNLENIQDCLNTRKKVQSGMSDLEVEYDALTNRLKSLRDQVLQDLTVLDSGLTSQ